jgi:thymidylate synthase
MINDLYKNMIIDIYKNGSIVSPHGMESKEIKGYKFVLSDINDNIITLPGFETNINYANEELKWYLTGTSNINFSPLIKKIWEKYSDDGINVNSNYGERIYGRHNIIRVNQWQFVADLLKNDSFSRQAVININSYFDKHESKDIPCTMFLQFLLRNNKLDMVTSMRSNDAFYGFRNDLYCFTELQKLMAFELKVDYGEYIHFAGSMHLYKDKYLNAERLLNMEGEKND